jgi:5-methylcytosine-specific restriction endonuclease McrA
MSIANSNDSDRRKLAAWSKAKQIPGFDGRLWRKDRFGWWIKFGEHGQTTEYGWEIDHIFPLSLGGALTLPNEAATHWRANRAKSNHFIG